VSISKYFFASGFPGSVRVFIASLPGLSGLHVTQKPLIRIEDNNSNTKTHHPRVNTSGEVNKFKPIIHSYLQLIASNYRSVTGFVIAVFITGVLSWGVGMVLFTYSIYSLGVSATVVATALAPVLSQLTTRLVAREPYSRRVVAGALLVSLGIVIHAL
jgi:hypothetical protein